MPQASTAIHRNVRMRRKRVVIDLTRIRPENPAFNYGFFRPNSISSAKIDQMNADHGRNFTRASEPEQASLKVAAPVELKERVSVFQRLLIFHSANWPLSNPWPSESGRGRLDDRRR